MSIEGDLLASIDLIYEASFDSTLWPKALISLADNVGTAHVTLSAMDLRARTYFSIAPRTDPAMIAAYRQYWAFHNPVWRLSAARPGEIYLLDNLMPREDFAATAVFNEWFRPAEFGLATMSANLFTGDGLSALIAVANAPGNDEVTSEQKHIFKAAVQHIDRAVRIHRELRMCTLDHDTDPNRLESLQCSVILVDGAARVLFANGAARRLLSSGAGLAFKGGYLHSTDGSVVLQRLIASSMPKAPPWTDHGGATSVCGGLGHSSLRVTVTPLRSNGTVAELPWLAAGVPMAMVTVVDPACEMD